MKIPFRGCRVDEAIVHHTVVRDRLRVLSERHSERLDSSDWTTTFAAPRLHIWSARRLRPNARLLSRVTGDWEAG